ncbi:hypothetical protein [Streptomyces sp. BK79]|uniref:hypothetical protein n=1 Tax=Streptomyces sp. BK79 TaxID=3350097 RepID=UPI00376FED69
MTQNRFSTQVFARHRHGLATVSLAALTSLALTGCGSELNDGTPQRESAKNLTPQERPSHPSPEQEAFAAMLATYAQTCPAPGGKPSVPPAEPADLEPTQSLAPGERPPAEPIEPAPPTGPEAELNDRDWCASVHHEQRIVEALQKVAQPTPATVRKTLNDLGYIDEHIHGLKQDGRTTRFYLDLRESGGRLCETGLAAGETSDVTPCVALASGPFTVTTEKRP